MKTDGAQVTRNRDQLSFPFNARPQALTGYARFVESGTIKVTSGAIWRIGKADNTAPKLAVLEDGTGVYKVEHETTNGAVISTAATGPTIGDLVELVVQLSATGTVKLIQSINSATPVEALESVALVFAQTWSDSVLWFNSAGNAAGFGFIKIRDSVFVRGVKTMDQMRRIAGLI